MIMSPRRTGRKEKASYARDGGLVCIGDELRRARQENILAFTSFWQESTQLEIIV
jgi:hypothetical protein